MSRKESNSGFFENSAYVGRNAFAAIAVLTTMLGNFGAATISAITAIVSHSVGALVRSKNE